MSRSRLSLLSGAMLACIAAIAFASCGGDDAAKPTATASQSASSSSTQAVATKTAATTPTQSAQSAALSVAMVAGVADGAALGKPDAKATLLVFEDFQCPFCLQFNTTYLPTLLEYVKAGTLRIEYHNLPILGAESVKAAIAGECMAAQDLFWPMFQRLFSEQLNAGQLTKEQTNIGRFSDANLAKFAADVGADPAKFAACFTSPDAIPTVQADTDQARTFGLRGTPGVVLNGSVIPTPQTVAELRKVLDAATK